MFAVLAVSSAGPSGEGGYMAGLRATMYSFYTPTPEGDADLSSASVVDGDLQRGLPRAAPMAPYLATSSAVSRRLICSLSRRSPSHLAPHSLGQQRVSFADAVSTVVGTSIFKRSGKPQTLILWRLTSPCRRVV